LSRRAIIAGAGIGGLATALALSQAGFDITLYERSEGLEEFGAGLQLTPNATRVLSRLEVLENVLALATRPSAVCVFRGSDDFTLTRMPVADAEQRWGAPYLAIHRADLQRVLAEAVRWRPNVELHFGTTVGDIAIHGDRISVGVTRGLTTIQDSADLLIGADGLRSRVRERFGLGEADKPALAGRVAFRATVDAPRIDSRWMQRDVCVRLGPNAHLVHYPLRGGSILNLVAVIESAWRGGAADDHPWDGLADRPALNRAFSRWSKATHELLAATGRWRAWPLYCRPPIASFSLGRMALLGDAAHPMAPFLAQGAAQAIEDAGALKCIFSQTKSVPNGLIAYSRDRVGRAARIQIEAQRQGRIYHLNGPMAFARDAMMKLLGPDRLSSRYDWLYGA
jgi:salicylate hydroxylase